MVDLRHQGRKAERAKRDMAGATQAASSDRTPRGLTGHPIIPGPRPQNTEMGPNHFLDATKMVDLTIALLTGVIVMGVSV